MSWALFKRNILRKTDIRFNSTNINNVAKIWADEYDAVVKRGFDYTNLESVQRGNKELMESFFRIALLKGLSTPPGVNFSIPNEFGNGVKAYWAGAQMRNIPIPIIPAPGSILNIAVNSNIVTNPGVWPLYPPIRPATRNEIMIDMFILAALVHLFSIGGIIQTTSLYSAAPTPIPAPGLIIWSGYIIPPRIPSFNLNFPSKDGSEPPIITRPDTDTSTIFLDSVTDTQTNNDIIAQTDILNGDTSLENIINVSIPADVASALEIDEIVANFKQQIKIGGVKCD